MTVAQFSMKYGIGLVVFSLILVNQVTMGQSIEHEKYGIHNANEITTIFYNYGTVSSPNTDYDIVWPSHNGLGYAFEMGFFVGGEVADTNGAIKHIISEHIADGGDRSPGGLPWGWLPVNGFANPESETIAMSDQPDTWPDTWEQWPGVHGEGEIIATQESYARMNDFTNQEFAYYPFVNDSTKRGLGLEVDVRSFQWNAEFSEDFIIWEYTIKNVSDKTLPELRAGFYGDPHVGGRNDYADDNTEFINSTGHTYSSGVYTLVQNLLYSWDNDFVGDNGIRPGFLGVGLLQNSSGLVLEYGNTREYGTRILPGQDEAFWSVITAQSDLSQVTDNIVYVSTNAFSLAPNESKTFTLTTVFGHTESSLFEHFINAQIAYAVVQGVDTHTVDLTLPNAGEEISGMQDIQWNTISGTGEDCIVDIFYTQNRGNGWQLLADGVSANGTISWETTNFPDGYNYQIQAIARSDITLGRRITSHFTVNNSTAPTEPDLLFLAPLELEEVSGVLDLHYRAGDTDGDIVTVFIQISQDGGTTWESVDSTQINGTAIYAWDSTTLPNGPNYQLRLSATDGTSFVNSQPSSVFRIQNTYPTIPDSNFTHIQGQADGSVRVDVVDTLALAGHTYQIFFHDSLPQATYDVYDVTTEEYVLQNVTQLTPEQQGPVFDGVRLLIANIPKGTYDTTQTGWAEGDANLATNIGLYTSGEHRHSSTDYQIVFSDTPENTDFFGNAANLRVFDLHTESELEFALFGPNADGLVEPGNKIVLLDSLDGEIIATFEIEFEEPQTGDPISPGENDVFQLITKNRFTSEDIYEFTTSDWITGTRHSPVLPITTQLLPNFPNPFNPSTTIEYYLPKSSLVQIRIYNLRGQMVKELVHDVQNPGTNRVIWNGMDNKGKKVASGVYLYELQTHQAHLVRKMILLR